jgi:hypothetical protein
MLKKEQWNTSLEGLKDAGHETSLFRDTRAIQAVFFPL